MKQHSRRSFLKQGASLAIAAAAAESLLAQALPESAPTTRQADMPYRTLGRTGEKVSLIGLGGAHIARGSEEDTFRVMRTAVDRGINFFDNSWDYSNGVAELRMGKALADGYRAKVFLMTKFDGRTKALALKQIDESLTRLQTDHLDLIQFHENVQMTDPDRFFADGGAAEAVLEAKKAGKARYIGFTGHRDPAIHQKMLDMAAQRNFRFDTVQMPLSVMDAHFRSFEKNVLPILVREQIGVLAMKTMGFGAFPSTGIVTGIECLHYAMNLPTSVVITGMENMSRLEQALEAARTFKPMTQEQLAALLERTKAVAADGSLERFKTTASFDGTARNPQWTG
jgi:aryl-alcohol dehydrogenase-like predicted oxidoreductase